MTDARFVVVEYDGVVPDGQLIEDAVFQQHLDVAPHRGVADFGLDVEALAVLSDFKWASDGEKAVVMQREYLHSLKSFGDGLREGSGLYDVAAVIDVAEDGAVAGEDALLLVIIVHVEKQGLVLGLPALLLRPSGEGFLPCGNSRLGRVIIRRDAQVCQRELRRYYRVFCDDVGRRVLGAVSGGLNGHSRGQSLGAYLFPFEVYADVSGGLCGLLCGIFH